MTPSTSLTLQGFLQGLHATAVGLVVSIITILVVLFVVRWFINMVARDSGIDTAEAASARSWANSIAGIVALIVLVGFAVNAASFATNATPHSDLDKSSVYEQMNTHIQKQR